MRPTRDGRGMVIGEVGGLFGNDVGLSRSDDTDTRAIPLPLFLMRLLVGNGPHAQKF